MAHLTKDFNACSSPAFELSASSNSQSTGLGDTAVFIDIEIAEEWSSSECVPEVMSIEPGALEIKSLLAVFDRSTIASLELCMAESQSSQP